MSGQRTGDVPTALHVADYFIDCSGYTKTQLQVQKMTYISHGYTLAFYNVPLFGNKVEAWDMGPVIPDVYHKFKKWRFSPIGKLSAPLHQFDTRTREVLDRVFSNYGRFCGYYLSQITHEDGDIPTPWKQCYQPGVNAPIPDDITKQYYQRLIAQ